MYNTKLSCVKTNYFVLVFVLQVRVEGRQQYLAAVCMGCLEGWSVSLRCCYCSTKWNGSALILGTMYSFDIFAAMPCCEARLKVRKSIWWCCVMLCYVIRVGWQAGTLCC